MNTFGKSPLTSEEIQILESALFGTEYARRIDDIRSRIERIEGINVVHSLLSLPGGTISEWGEKKRLIQFFVASILRPIF